MGEASQTDYGRLNKQDALEDAVSIQTILYGWDSPHIRNYKGFSAEKYEGADLTLEAMKGAGVEIGNLPKIQPQRDQRLRELLVKYPSELLVESWRKSIEESHPRSKEFQRFSGYSQPIFESADRNYFMMRAKTEKGSWHYGAASQFYIPLAYQLYHDLSNEPYFSPQELKYNMQKALDGKKVLEIAPGPGYFMKVLKDLGADVKGVDKDTTHDYVAKGWGLDIRQGDASKLDSVFPEQFDVIISNNFLNDLTLTPEQAQVIMKQIMQMLKPGGISVHSTQYGKRPLELVALIRILTNKPDKEDWIKALDNPPKREVLLDTDAPVLSEKQIIGNGVENFSSAREAGYYVFSFNKPKT